MTTTETVQRSVDLLRESVRERPALAGLADVYTLASQMGELLNTAAGLLTHASSECLNAAGDPNLRVDELGEPIDPASTAVRAGEAFQAAYEQVYRAAARVSQAQTLAGRLYVAGGGD
ncbi:hypothetical protein [Haloactinopolyspora sp.]|uniref:hypothetical protein n=1 Tax=Haloactinopolyspora sp. TaxID=1966353 RepID=UPI002628F20D|nr:hypothetical protein [Haloactinopolyspora sp.]